MRKCVRQISESCKSKKEEKCLNSDLCAVWTYNMYISWFPWFEQPNWSALSFKKKKEKKYELNSHAKFLTSANVPEVCQGNPLFMHQQISFSVLFIILLKETDFIILIWAAKMIKKTSVRRSSHSSNMLVSFIQALFNCFVHSMTHSGPFLLFRQNYTHLSDFPLARVLLGCFVKYNNVNWGMGIQELWGHRSILMVGGPLNKPHMHLKNFFKLRISWMPNTNDFQPLNTHPHTH